MGWQRLSAEAIAVPFALRDRLDSATLSKLREQGGRTHNSTRAFTQSNRLAPVRIRLQLLRILRTTSLPPCHNLIASETLNQPARIYIHPRAHTLRAIVSRDIAL